jgi:hypothetical protein
MRAVPVFVVESLSLNGTRRLEVFDTLLDTRIACNHERKAGREAVWWCLSFIHPDEEEK